jgi:hypothetical protein
VVVRSGADTRHAYARFDLEPLASLPPGTPVGRAVLRAWVGAVPVPGSIDVHPALQPWDEGTLTWNTAAALGPAIASVAIAADDRLDYVTVDVTDLVQDWLDGALPNQGLALVPGSGGVRVDLDSKESPFTSHPMELEVVLEAAVGPPGPAGPAGPPGPQGPPGSLPAVMCPAGQALQGINANGTPVCVPLGQEPGPATTITTLDASGIVGWDTSITMGADGLGLISYFDVTNQDLKVAHCGDAACTSAAAITSLDVAGSVGRFSSITVGNDGLGLISYHDADNGALKVAHCGNADCTAAATVTTVAAGSVGRFTSITTGADGLGLISYFDATNGSLKVAHCANAACTSATLTTLDSGGVGSYTSITTGADGMGLISYFDSANEDLKVAHCANAACTAVAAITSLDAQGSVGRFSSITLGGDGLGLISYHDADHGALKAAHCANAACTAGVMTTLAAGSVGRFTSIATGADGLGLISYHDDANGDLEVAHCGGAACMP